MDRTGQNSEPTIYMPAEAATATAPDGHKLVFFTVPQLEVLINQILAARHQQYTYRWAYHPGHKVHVLFFAWPEGEAAAIAIPEGPGDIILEYMAGASSHVFLTTEPVQERLRGRVDHSELQEIILAKTLYLPDVVFSRDA